jgi:dUTP pyrophosphatase
MIEIKLKYNEIVADDSKENVLPYHGSELAAGYDLTAIEDPEIVGDTSAYNSGLYRRVSYIQYKTGIHISPPMNKTFSSVGDEYYDVYHTLIFPRSSVSKYNLQLANCIGLIDTDYSGQLLLRFNYIWQPEDLHLYSVNDKIRGSINMDLIYKKGDKIGQLVANKTTFMKFNVVDNLNETSRGDGGFGSTGK